MGLRRLGKFQRLSENEKAPVENAGAFPSLQAKLSEF